MSLDFRLVYIECRNSFVQACINEANLCTITVMEYFVVRKNIVYFVMYTSWYQRRLIHSHLFQGLILFGIKKKVYKIFFKQYNDYVMFY